jgi:ATP-dependent Clp protease ATP-binding subunit ClpC
MRKLPQTPRAKMVIEFAIDEARRHNHRYVASEHLLLGLLREEEGVANQALRAMGATVERARGAIGRRLAGVSVEPGAGASNDC